MNDCGERTLQRAQPISSFINQSVASSSRISILDLTNEKMRFFHSGLPFRSSKNLYQVLGIPPSSDKKAIKARFYELSMQFHPDRNQDNEDAHVRFLEINEAYSVLGNDLKRREYDRSASRLSDVDAPTRTSGSPRTRAYAYRQPNLRPDDWIQYRHSTKGASQAPKYDFNAHQSTHYGPGEAQRLKRQYRQYKFQRLRDEARELTIPTIIGVSVFFTLLYESGIIQMIWL